MSYDEHGPVVDPTPEYGPEWWAMDREFICDYCGHSAHDHADRVSDNALAPCQKCTCDDFESEAADASPT